MTRCIPLIVGGSGYVGWGGRIHYVELRTGLNPAAGSVLWRFDANDYPGTGTVYTDPRGRTWTLTSAAAISAAMVVGPDVPQTALRYRRTLDEAALADAAQRGVLYTRAFDYNTVEIFWGIPGKVCDKWAEVAIVRSAFGYPETVNDGQTIFRHFQETLFPPATYPNGMPEGFTFEPIYDVRDPATGGKPKLTSGRYYYYSLFFRINFQWIRSMTAATLLPRDHRHGEHLWDTLPPYYRWIDDQQRDGDGDLKRFLRVFGFELDTIREFVENWQELYHIDFSPVPLLRRLGRRSACPTSRVSGTSDTALCSLNWVPLRHPWDTPVPGEGLRGGVEVRMRRDPDRQPDDAAR